MGGPMSVNEEAVHPWLRPEKRLISQSIEVGKTVLGICLGAQLIASALGARVFPNARKEIGWFPVRRPTGSVPDLARLFADGIEVFHWHGETFDLPHGAVKFLESDACENQAFSLGSRVLGLQFHLETTHASAASLMENSRHEMLPVRYHSDRGRDARPARAFCRDQSADGFRAGLSFRRAVRARGMSRGHHDLLPRRDIPRRNPSTWPRRTRTGSDAGSLPGPR